MYYKLEDNYRGGKHYVPYNDDGTRADGKPIGQTPYQSLKDSGYSDDDIYKNPGLTTGDGGKLSDAGNKRVAKAETAEEMDQKYEYAVKMITEMFEQEEKATQRHLERVPELGEMGRDEAALAGDFINERLREDFYGVLDDLVPEWREKMIDAGVTGVEDISAITEAFKENILPEALKRADEISFQMLDNVQSQLRGEINPDVADQLKRQAAEISQQIGVRGQAAKYLTARDLGLTSMDIQQQGMQNAPAAMQFAPGAYSALGAVTQAPMQSAGNLTNILAAYRSPTAEWQSLWGANLGLVTAGAVMPGGTAFQTSGQAFQYAGNMYDNSMNTAMQFQANAQAMQMQQSNMRAQNRANILGVVGGVAGGIFGGPAGAAAGAGAGASLG